MATSLLLNRMSLADRELSDSVLHSPRPQPLSHSLFSFAESESLSISSLERDSERDRERDSEDALSLQSLALANHFNEHTWADAYATTATLEPLPSDAALRLSMLHLDEHEDDDHDNEDDEDDGNVALTPGDILASPYSHVRRTSTPNIVTTLHPHLNTLRSVSNRRFSESSYLSSPRFPSKSRAQSPKVDLIYSSSPQRKLTVNSMSGFSYATTSNDSDLVSCLDHDDRFIQIVYARLRHLDEQQSQQQQQQQQQLNNDVSSSEISSAKSSLKQTLIGSWFSASNVTPRAPHLTTAPESIPVHPNIHTQPSQPQSHSSPLLSFISRAFGPRRTLDRTPTPTTAATTTTNRPLSISTSTLQTHKDVHKKRASMPHVPLSTWSSTTNIPSRTIVSSSYSSSTWSSSLSTEYLSPITSPTSSTNPSAITDTKPEIRAKIQQAIKLFELGATEAAFTEFQKAVFKSQVSIPSVTGRKQKRKLSNGHADAFAEFCLAVCFVYGFGVRVDLACGVEMLRRCLEKGEGLAGEELERLGQM